MSGSDRSPRFRDAHTHLAAGAADLLGIDLRSRRTGDDTSQALAEAAGTVPPGAWIRGWGWDGETPPRDLAPRHPVFIARRDGHAAWLNAEARRALGLSTETPLVAEAAFDAARRQLPERSSSERVEALRPRVAELFGSGVAAVDDMVEPWAPEVYAVLRDRGELPVAIGMWLPETLTELDAEAIRRAFPEGDAGIATRGIKIFLDGSLFSRTAALSRPYADDPACVGALRIPERDVDDRVLRWASKGWPVAIHAIGDLAVSIALDAIERAPRPRHGAHRIEHAQVVLRADLPRFSRLGVAASLQPGHWRDDRAWLSARLGARPEVVAHPLRSLARSGATILFGSDWPVSDWSPETVLAAATDPERGDEALDAAEASAWYTSRPPCPTPSSSKGSSSTASMA